MHVLQARAGMSSPSNGQIAASPWAGQETEVGPPDEQVSAGHWGGSTEVGPLKKRFTAPSSHMEQLPHVPDCEQTVEASCAASTLQASSRDKRYSNSKADSDHL